MNEQTPAQLRRERTAELARIKTLKAKLCAIIASADECDKADQNAKVGNLAFDIETITNDLLSAGHRLYVTCDAIRVTEYEAAQRQAEIDHGPLIDTLRAIIAGPNVIPIRPAPVREKEGAA